MLVAAFPVSQWLVGTSLAGHSCGNSAGSTPASLLPTLSGGPVAERRVANDDRECKRHGQSPRRGSPAGRRPPSLRVVATWCRMPALRNGGLAGIRTRDLQIKSPLLYQLSYEPALRCGKTRALCATTLSVKPCQQLPRRQMRHGIAPVGCNLNDRCEHEFSLAKFGMRDRQSRRRPDAAAPPDNIEVKWPIPPTAAGATTCSAFDCF